MKNTGTRWRSVTRPGRWKRVGFDGSTRMPSRQGPHGRRMRIADSPDFSEQSKSTGMLDLSEVMKLRDLAEDDYAVEDDLELLVSLVVGDDTTALDDLPEDLKVRPTVEVRSCQRCGNDLGEGSTQLSTS